MDYPHDREFERLFPEFQCKNKVELAFKAANEFNVSILLKEQIALFLIKKQLGNFMVQILRLLELG